MAYEWPDFARHWGLHLRPFELQPYIVPKDDNNVKEWQKLMIKNVDWPRPEGLSVGQALTYKMWIVQPFAQILMPLQHDYILFRRKSVETLQRIIEEQQTLQGVVATLAENDRWMKETIDTCGFQLNNKGQQISRTEASVIQLEQRINFLQNRIHVLECKMKDKDEIIALLVSRNVPWEEIDPGATVPILQRIQEAQRWKQARSRSVSPHHSRAPSPAPSDNC